MTTDIDEVRKALEAGELTISDGKGGNLTFKLSPELQKAMKKNMAIYDRKKKSFAKKLLKAMENEKPSEV